VIRVKLARKDSLSNHCSREEEINKSWRILLQANLARSENKSVFRTKIIRKLK
jgi:hypothetical protein